MTFSIVAVDPVTGDLGVAAQSRFLGVGALVPWARAGVGAVATQAQVDAAQKAVRDGMATLNPLAVQVIGQLSSLEI